MKDNLLEHEVYGLLQKAGMSAPNWTFVKNGHSLSLATGEKYVAKIVKRDLLHKSDSGGIVFNVTSATAAQSKEELLKKFKDAEGVLFVEQIEYERSAELILGGYVDPFFGPLVTIGFGGTATDLFADIMKKGKAKAVFPAGLDAASVSAIVAELPIVKMVTGNVRGYKKLVDLDAILKAVGSIQKILNGKHDGQEVEEIEVNPLVCADGKLWALDGVCRTRGVAGGAPAKPLNKIGSLLNPKSACIVGASGKNPYNPANVILKNLLSAGIPKEKMFLVHPKEDEIEGIKCEKSLADVVKKNSGLPVDLFVVGVPAKTAATLMEECFALNAANAIQVISAGFGETEGGRELQLGLENKLARLDRNKRPVINGPNTLGNIYKNVKTLFTSPKKNSGTGKGHENAALICQSGAFMITAISNMAGVVSPKVSMSVGNQMDVSVVDCLEYLIGAEPEIKTFGLYIEGLKDGDGKHLMELSKEARANNRYVVIYKAGRTKAGMDAAKGHTAAQAGDYSLFESLLASHGAIVTDTFVEFRNLLMLTALVKPIRHKAAFGVAALSNAGFEKCAIADNLMRSAADKIRLAEYSPATIDRLKAIYAAHNIAGIMDIHDILDLTPMMDDEGFEEMMRTTLADPAVDFGLYSAVPETLMLNITEEGSTRPEDVTVETSLISRLIKIYKETEKPFCFSMESGWKYNKFAEHCCDAGIPCFRHADQAARAVDKLLMSAI